MTSGRKDQRGRRTGPATRTSAYRSASESQGPTTDPAAAGSGDQGPTTDPSGEKEVPETHKSPAVGEEQAAENEGAEVSEDLDALLADVQRERDEYLELARRAKADFENYRKRAAKDAQEAERRGKAALARELVPVLDNLERALKATDEESELTRGVELVRGNLEETLNRAGVETYDPLGERFDPAWHEALSSRPSEDQEAGLVVETLERGYRLDGQVLRPARVVVSA
jgi:molecular chaperone GrpE